MLLIQQLLKTFHEGGVEEVQKTGPQTWEQIGAVLIGILFPIGFGWVTICQRPQYLTFKFLCLLYPFLLVK